MVVTYHSELPPLNKILHNHFPLPLSRDRLMANTALSDTSETLTNKTNKTKGKEGRECVCPICDDPILDTKGRRKGQDIIFCDGIASAKHGCTEDALGFHTELL